MTQKRDTLHVIRDVKSRRVTDTVDKERQESIH